MRVRIGQIAEATLLGLPGNPFAALVALSFVLHLPHLGAGIRRCDEACQQAYEPEIEIHGLAPLEK
jgi:molybdopterin biosynthesis enzyme